MKTILVSMIMLVAIGFVTGCCNKSNTTTGTSSSTTGYSKDTRPISVRDSGPRQ